MTAPCPCGCGNRPPEGHRYASPACRSKASRDRLYIRRSDLAAMSDEELFALCRQLRKEHAATSALATLSQIVKPAITSQQRNTKPCADSPAE